MTRAAAESCNRCAAARLPANCSVSRLTLFVGGLDVPAPLPGCLTAAGQCALLSAGLEGAAWALPARRHRPPDLPLPALPPAPASPAALVACIVLVSLTFDAQKIEGLLVWVQDNKGEGSVLFLVGGGCCWWCWLPAGCTPARWLLYTAWHLCVLSCYCFNVTTPCQTFAPAAARLGDSPPARTASPR